MEIERQKGRVDQKTVIIYRKTENDRDFYNINKALQSCSLIRV